MNGSATHASLARVGLFIDSMWSGLAIALARRLRETYGSTFHGYVRTPREASGYRHLIDEGVLTSITASSILDDAIAATGLGETTVTERASALEARLGVTVNWLSMFHRHFGRGYNTGSFEFPRLRYFDDIGYVQMLHGFNEQMAFWEREVTDKSLTLFLFGPPFVAIQCRASGIPYRLPDTIRYRDYWLWTVNEYYFAPQLETTYHQLTSWADVDLSVPYDFAAGSFKRVYESVDLVSTSKKVARFMAASLYARLRGGGRQQQSLRQYMRRLRRQRQDLRLLTGPMVSPLSALEGKRFFYYPLHKEPEFSLHQISPEYFNQLPAITSICRDLPAGVLLAVKEHPRTIGTRNRQFYEKIADLKNVVMLDVRENGVDCVRKAMATVTITGSAGSEAAVNGSPVITFGRHNLYGVMPHVMTVTDEAQIGGYIDRVVSGEFDQDTCRDHGARYIAALKANAFDMRGLGARGKFGTEIVDTEIVDAALRTLVDSLDLPNVNAIRQQHAPSPGRVLRSAI